MAEGSKCICCQKEIFEEQDYTTLICHAAGQATSHTTLAHDKCWEKFARTARRISGPDAPRRLARWPPLPRRLAPRSPSLPPGVWGASHGAQCLPSLRSLSLSLRPC